MAPVSTRSSSPLEMTLGSTSACSAAAAKACAAAGNPCSMAAPARGARGDGVASDTSGHSRPRRQHVLGGWAHSLYLQIEQARRIETQDVALLLLGQEGNGGDGARRIEVPVRP